MLPHWGIPQAAPPPLGYTLVKLILGGYHNLSASNDGVPSSVMFLSYFCFSTSRDSGRVQGSNKVTAFMPVPILFLIKTSIS